MTANIQVIHADSLEYLKTLQENSLDACVADSPYGLGDPPDPEDVLRQWALTGDWEDLAKKAKKGGFMGHEWDRFVPGVSLWREVHRVLKPGAFLATFGGTRTWDWISLSLRFARFNVLDTLMWLYGSGWPKGGNIGRKIDDTLGKERKVLGVAKNQSCKYLLRGEECRCYEGVDKAMSGEIRHQPVTAPASPEAEMWEDCSSRLKPGWEPIILCQKPLEGSIASNCLKHGVGGLQIGKCRIAIDPESVRLSRPEKSFFSDEEDNDETLELRPGIDTSQGRWPANIIFTHNFDCTEDTCTSGCPVTELDEQSGFLHPSGNKNNDRKGFRGMEGAEDHIFKNYSGKVQQYDLGGYASRFYYCAKASKRDKQEGLPKGLKNKHNTVKPTNLMRWLVRLLTPPGGTLLDPFAGSGSTGKAAALEGLNAILIEQDEKYHEIASKRVEAILHELSQGLNEDWF